MFHQELVIFSFFFIFCAFYKGGVCRQEKDGIYEAISRTTDMVPEKLDFLK